MSDKRLHLRLGVIAEHVRRDLVLVAGRMADADAHAAEIGAEMRRSSAGRYGRRCRRRRFTLTLNGARSSSSWKAVSASTSSL